MAAGFTIETAKIELLKKDLLKRSSALLNPDILQRKLLIDLNLDIRLIDKMLYSQIKKMSPFGMGNPEPTFLTEGMLVKNVRLLGKEKNHLRVILSKDGVEFEAIYFRGADNGIENGVLLDVVYTIDENSWNGMSKLQLKILDAKLSLPHQASS